MKTSTLMSLGLGVLLVLCANTAVACKFDWTKGAYCGAGSTTRLIPDRLFGPFTAACRTHDWCYFAAGEQIAKELEEGYLKTQSDINRRKATSKQQCDSYFHSELSEACSQTRNPVCGAAADEYANAVSALGFLAFKRSIQNAQACQ